MIKNAFFIKGIVAVGMVLSLWSCADSDPEEVILDGITIETQITKIKFSQVVVSEITSSSAFASADLVSLDPNFEIIEAGYVLSPVNSLPTDTDIKMVFGEIEEPVKIESELTALDPATVYYIRAYVETSSGFGYGNPVAFTTDDAMADVVVINEGNFTSGDGSFSTYNSLTGEVELSVFASANGFPVAATIQNAVIYNDAIYAVTNAGDKVEVINSETFESEALINSGFQNPYSFAAIDEKAYVTNWGVLNTETYAWEGSFISIVDLESNAVVDSILLAVQPQHVLAYNDHFYVSNVGGSTISVYDPATNGVIETIEVSFGPDKMVVDVNDDIWVMCTSGTLVKIDGETNDVELTISEINGSGYNERMVISEAGDVLYYVGTSAWPDATTYVYELAITETAAPESELISGENFYGVGISNEVIYVTDHNAYQGNGFVHRFGLDGAEINTFAAGRIPSGFVFR